MLVKCGRKEYEVGKKDYILGNGACYQLILHKDIEKPLHLRISSPKVSKKTFNKLLKDNKIIEFENYNGYADCIYFRFVLEEKIEDTVCENCEGINVVYIGNEHDRYYCKDCGYES